MTIGGESAGGWSVCGHLSAPGSRGLFARAVIESGSCLSWPQADADSSADQVASQVGCPATAVPAAVACLRQVPVQALLDAANNWFGPLLVNDTPTLPQDPFLAVTSGAFTHVPVLIGANRTGPGLTPIPGYEWGAGGPPRRTRLHVAKLRQRHPDRPDLQRRRAAPGS